jgi:hypothetical protein
MPMRGEVVGCRLDPPEVWFCTRHRHGDCVS